METRLGKGTLKTGRKQSTWKRVRKRRHSRNSLRGNARSGERLRSGTETCRKRRSQEENGNVHGATRVMETCSLRSAMQVRCVDAGNRERG